MTNETSEATVQTTTYPDCETEDSTIPPGESSSAIVLSRRSRIVKMTGATDSQEGEQ